MMYTFKLHLAQTEGGELGGQNALTIINGRWSICSSNVSLFGMKGLYDFAEKVGGIQCTNFYDQGVVPDDATKAMFRFLVFQGGDNDHKTWDVGKSGEGQWLNMPDKFKGLLERSFRWSIWMIDGRDKPLPPG